VILLITSKLVTLVVMVKLLKPKTKIRVARNRFKRMGLVFLFLCFFAFVFYLVFKSDFLTVKNVNCSVKDKTSIADEKRWCEGAERQLLGQRIFLSNLDAAAPELERKFLPVGGVTIERKLPQTVNVQIKERAPIAKVCPPGGRELLVDKEGAIYAETQPDSQNIKTVVLELGFELKLGQEVGPDVVSLILLEEPQISFVKYTGQEGLEARANGRLSIFLSREKSLKPQLEDLQRIIQKYRIEGKNLSQVDLRYDQPVIKY